MNFQKKGYILIVSLIVFMLITLGIFQMSYSTHPLMPLESDVIEVSEHISTQSSSQEKKLHTFLEGMSTSSGFISTRIDTSNESIDQTYYYFKILNLLNPSKNDDLNNDFVQALYKEVIDNPLYYVYLDILKTDQTVFTNKINHKIDIDLQKQFACIDCLEEASPYIIYYGTLSNNEPVSDIATKIIGDFILEESDSETLVFYLKWYFDLIEMGGPIHTSHSKIEEVGLNLLNELNVDRIFDVETLYNAFSLSMTLEKPFKMESIINKIKTRGVDYSFDLRAIYYNLKLMELADGRIDKEFKQSYMDYLQETQKTSTNFYPLVAYEENNIIEMFQWEILMSSHNRQKRAKTNNLSDILEDYIKNGDLTDSQVEIFYQTLYANENNIEIPKSKSLEIIEKVNGETKIIENYYLFQAAYFQGYQLRPNQKELLREEISKAFLKNDFWSILVGIDLDYIFNDNEANQRKLWQQVRIESDNLQTDMSSGEFFMYQILKHRNGDTVGEDELNTYYDMHEIEDVVLLKGDHTILSVETIYQYLLLLQLTKV
ncbi:MULTISPECIES: hypothetical protein [Exiguobacterium]|uniref:hypothetical protein n=1 Tax=Exiguobacterium TaxID=33986 RepID=UPI001BEB42C9|nr:MULTISPECIES: hypothetical protein [Exiguobacterium]MCT4784273.1 hypothetical protein [Exiguobacterium himgiriensis]